MKEALWRIWNAEPTARPWQVAEVMFYTDLFCEEDRQVFGTAISSGSFFEEGCVARKACDPFLPSRAFDGKKSPGLLLPNPLPTKWKAKCHEWDGCAAYEASIGLDFDIRPVQVRCMRVYQPAYEGYPGLGHPHYSGSLLLQFWNGWRWTDRQIYTGFGQGEWYDTMPKQSTSWRIANYDRIGGAWRVYGIEMFTTMDCSGAPLEGDAVDSNPALLSSDQVQACWSTVASCGKLAFDHDPITAWESSCGPCDQRKAWIGLRFQEVTEIKCWRILQSEDVLHRTDAVELSEWMGDKWVKRGDLETGIGGGTWNRRPTADSTMWRLIATQPTERPWTVTNIAFYEDAICNTPYVAQTITSGNEKLFRSEHAFDDDAATKWVASCTPDHPGHKGCMGNSAWLGMQWSRGVKVRCLRLYQDRTRVNQASNAVLQVWTGSTWAASKSHPVFTELGGGAWQVLPGFRGSMWRVLADPAPGGMGVAISEMSFFSNSDCTGDLPMAVPNVVPICSGYAMSREIGRQTGYVNHYFHMGELSGADPTKAFDKQFKTFWADLGGKHAWLGLDFSTQVVDVQCIKLAIASVRVLQPVYAELQGWNGETWKAETSARAGSLSTDSTLLVPLYTLGGGGMQRRPAPPDSIWRVQNVPPVKAWRVFELEFYANLGCHGQPVKGTAIGSAKDAGLSDRFNGQLQPLKAFDRDTSSFWEADCIDENCPPRTAWIGLDLEGQPAEIRCIRIIQSGNRAAQVPLIGLAAWRGEDFVETVVFQGVGGDTWNIRPAPPDTLWRVSYGQRMEKLCYGQEKQRFTRSWGVMELEFFADDACTKKLPGPEDGVDVIASGTREVGLASLAGTGPHLAFDGKDTTTWAAQCGASKRPNEDVDCREGVEWLGLDFNRKYGGLPVEIKCFRLKQSRSTGPECCDPAHTVKLERWNGSSWRAASWRHTSDGGDLYKIEGEYTEMAQCPSLDAEQLQNSAQDLIASGATTRPVEAERTRRQSDVCIIPNPGSVKLLADPFCEKHPACKAAGYVGNCCPASPGMSRCCCRHNMQADVFEDERDFDANRNLVSEAPPTGFELIMIRSASVMPFLGLAAAICTFLLYAIPKPAPSADGSLSFKERMWYRFCSPLHKWIASKGLLSKIVALLIVRGPMDQPLTLIMKRFAWLLLGFTVGAMLLWMIMAYVFAELILKIILSISYIIRGAKSRYDPKKPAEQRRLMIVLGIPIGDPGGGNALGLKLPDIGGAIAGFAQSVMMSAIFVVQSMFDILIVRVAFMSISAVDLRLSPLDILVTLPNPGIDVSILANFIYGAIDYADQLYQSTMMYMFAGAPRCEGPVVVMSACFLIIIVLLLVRWLNYDYFGVLVSAKYSAVKTRPLFQKSMAVGAAAGAQAAIFIAMQCLMLISSRAISLVQIDPFKEGTSWQCPYDGQDMSVLTGRLFLLFMALLVTIMTFLCANGHFMGQDYILKPFGKQIGMDLDRLDPDGGGDDGGVMRLGTFLSALPTTLGIWIDGWNVEGYLLKERAMIYAEELRVPGECPHCGFCHIPYQDLMKATGKQLSLAYQIFPFGAVIGKGCEYLNNPPMLYIGSKLKCLNAAPTVTAVKKTEGRKMSSAQTAKYYVQLAMAFLKDWFFPGCVRVGTLGVYCVLVYFTAVMDTENVAEKGKEMFQYIITLCAVKAFCEVALPVICLVILGIFLVAAGTVVKVASKAAKPFKYSPVIGQVLHGVTTGFAVGFFFSEESGLGLTATLCTIFGAAAGAAEGMLVVLYAYMLELCPNCDLSGDLCKVGLAIVVASGCSLLLSAQLEENGIWLTLAAMLTILVPGTNLAFRKSPMGLDGYRAPSSIWPLLSTPRILSGPFGIAAGVFCALAPYQIINGAMGPYWALLMSCSFGYGGGLAYAVATDQMVTNRPGRYAMAAGTLTALACGLLVHWAIGVSAGSVVGSVVGVIVERKMMKEADKKCFEPPRFTKAQIQANPSMGAVANTVAMLRDEEREGKADVINNLPTLCKAVTPGASLSRAQAIDDGYGNAYEEYHRQQQQLQEQQMLEMYGDQLQMQGQQALALQAAQVEQTLALEQNAYFDDPNSTALVEAMGQSQGSWQHSYGEAEAAGALTETRRLPNSPTKSKAGKRTSLAASANKAKGMKIIHPPGPRSSGNDQAWDGFQGASPASQQHGAGRR
eukprot:TRINITY_DN2071_c0_g1_i1.p1 TRINITY_DN2071_c0_g1~~TRINITY_DN2071_c0_g1_i1.p1  ORF type:complete len:2399 (+),score=409.38 TRINITY_DN2071_c0_g1_i1:693-7199(+)